jgi:glycerol-1-phosphate dehydrogenase [NAD(P)+]
MILTERDFEKYNANNGELGIKKIIIEKGCMKDFRKELRDLGLGGEICAIYDENTYKALKLDTGLNIILNPEGLHADERGVADIMRRLDAAADKGIRPEALVAVGAGTIHDLTRYCANQLSLPFISVPTAASMDGFASGVSAMTWHGFKKTLPGIAPLLIMVEPDVIRNAPVRLARSGIGDLLGKYIALCDWKVAHILTGEYYSDDIAALMMRAVNEAVECLMSREDERGQVLNGSFDLSDGSLSGDDYHEKLIYGLILSGVAMKLAGSSRPASGAEHHLSHMLEMGIPVKTTAMHGEKVGAATPLCARVYRGLLGIDDIAPLIKAPGVLKKSDLLPVFGELTDSVMEENQNGSLLDFEDSVLIERWDEVKTVIDTIPVPDVLINILRKAGAVCGFDELGVPDSVLPVMLAYGPYVRARFTVLRLLKRLLNTKLTTM